jgi:hypothetical protein
LFQRVELTAVDEFEVHVECNVPLADGNGGFQGTRECTPFTPLGK